MCGLMDSFGTAVSMILQYGVPLEVLVNKFSHTRFEPMGYTTNPDIRIAKSLVDYIFRWLGLSFIPGFREATLGISAASSKADGAVVPAKAIAKAAVATGTQDTGSQGSGAQSSGSQHVTAAANGKTASAGASRAQSQADLLDRAGARMREPMAGESSMERNDQFARFQSDAPSCDNCGAITVRNGNCYLCHNCGNSMGCS